MNEFDKKASTPIYYQVGNSIKNDILSGLLPLNSKLPAEEFLAKEFGIAKLTLRRALSKLAQEGYVRQVRGKGSFVARKLPNEKTISILLDRDDKVISTSPLPKAISGILLYLKEKKCSVRFDRLDELDKLLTARKGGEVDCDGVITLMFRRKNLDRLKDIEKSGLPYVSLGIPGPFNWVRLDRSLGMEKAFNYLLSLGHTEIGIGNSRTSSLDVKYKFGVAKELVKSTFGTVREDYCLDFKWKSVKDSSEHALKFLKRKNKPTAMLCTTDLVALPLLVQAPFVGVKVPEEMSIIGFEDLDACKYVYPALTTMRQDYFQLGCLAAEELLGIMEDCTLRKTQRKMEPELIIRDSCAAPSR